MTEVFLISKRIRQRLQEAGKRFWAGDNISEFIQEGEKEMLIDELTHQFQKVLEGLVIDVENDPNSNGTAKRLSKMYAYKGLLTVRSEIVSMCSHHHQPVKGVAYIGIIAGDTLIGLSKYTRIAQWCAKRGTLQEELAMDICREIMKATNSENVGVYVQATHGCVEHRGIEAHSSLTQTTVLEGAFATDPATKKEFMDNIKLQQQFAPK